MRTILGILIAFAIAMGGATIFNIMMHNWMHMGATLALCIFWSGLAAIIHRGSL